MEPTHSSFFEEAVSVTAIDLHTYAAFLKKDWCIGDVPHGGYTASILYRTTVHFANTHRARYKAFKSTPKATTFQVTFLEKTSVVPAILQVIPTGGIEWLYTRVNTKMLRGGRADVEVALDEQGVGCALLADGAGGGRRSKFCETNQALKKP
ncbi:hypothetical protein BJX63DRAFT_436547 [Aspergillus granulosus]|uniref:Acyl-CoA thioesterase-like N-terminal HotDog domain-containing protein n=1 Tax=Aspergillus granulosus TaxID=176169 RepID=A0ABR4GXP5_9EURO